MNSATFVVIDAGLIVTITLATRSHAAHIIPPINGAPRWVVLKPVQAPYDADSQGSAGITTLGVTL
ncbi:hypothetical protein ACFOEP_07985 [Microbacterium amylolyticum]|uniref:hypothetical protein n=1 Tax=Microbacterium amylolyticum TaxID=936337 RepID=UPI0013ED0361